MEESQKLSSQLLVDFQYHLELLRRDPLPETSGVITKVATASPSARLTKFLEAGGWHEYPARQVAAKYSAFRGLWDHINKAKVLLVDLESFVKKTNVLLEGELCLRLETMRIPTLDLVSEMDLEADKQLGTPSTIDGGLQTCDYVHMMSLTLSMLVEDVNMQEKIVHALALDTPMEALQTYSLMWTLRPFVDDAVVEQALSWIR